VHDHSITIRRLSLRFPTNIDPLFVEGRPEESYLFLGLSLLLPYLEPYLVRSLGTAKRLINDPQLTADIDAFIGQESQHFKLHIQFNKSLDLSKYQGLKSLEEKLEEDYRRFSSSASLRFNLAYAEGFEAFTMALARFVLEIGALDRLHPSARDLFRWHLVEELEHRTVAFDVYQQLCGSFVYRLGVGCFAQWHLCRFVLGVARQMTRGKDETFRLKYGGRWRLIQRWGSLQGLLLWRFVPKLVKTYMPWYTPHRIDMPELAKAFADEYTERVRSGSKNSEV
jgi:predicted metal-dependent hydrolase